MSMRIRVLAGLGAVSLLVLGAVPISQAADRLLPHAIQLWDANQCAPSDSTDHTLFGMAGPVLQPGHPDVQILDARPLGLSEGAQWRTWILPVARASGWTGSLGTNTPPAGWSRRVKAAGATVTSDHRTELDLEIWPGPGQSRTSVRGFLVTYRTTLGITRTARTPTTSPPAPPAAPDRDSTSNMHAETPTQTPSQSPAPETGLRCCGCAV